MTPKVRNCEECWLRNRQIVKADYHVDGRDLCTPHCRAEGYEIAGLTSIVQPIEQPKQDPATTKGNGRKRRTRSAVADSSNPEGRGPVTASKSCVSPEPLTVTAEKRPRESAAQPSGIKPRAPRTSTLPERKCEDVSCSKLFVPKRKDQKYCSNTCYQRNYAREHSVKGQLSERSCEGCGEQFKPRQSRSRFCLKCVSNGTRSDRIQLKERTCAAKGCSNKFMPKRKDHRFCSAECTGLQWKRDKRSDRRKGMQEKKCRAHGCKNRFVPKRKDQVFCSRECRNKSRNSVDLKVPVALNFTEAEIIAVRTSAAGMAAAEAGIALDDGMVNLRIPVRSLDQLWERLTIAEKTAIVEREMGA